MNKKNKIPTLDWLEDPEVFHVNRKHAHSDHSYYTSEMELESGAMTLQQSLNGLWKFSYAKNPKSRILDFYKMDFDSSDFTTIQVPDHIQMQGFDKCHYTNTVYPWDGHCELRPPSIDWNYNPVGSYITYFDINNELLDKRIFISFQGVETACYVWLNGQFIGYSEDSFTPSEFELSDIVMERGNKLAVEVYKRSSASWLEDQDFWRFSGIFRDVYLYAIPETHIEDIFVTTDLVDNYKNGELTAKLQIVGNQDASIRVLLKNREGNCLWKSDTLPVNERLLLNTKLSELHLWSGEDPYLYTLFIIIEDNKGNTIEIIPQKVGFRRFELIDNIMCLNGKRILFRGINRHEFNQYRGRSITKEDMLWDIRFLKQNNINAVRTSHYPNDSYWYKLCDEFGIYVMDEVNLESHGSWQKMGVCDPSWNVPGSLPQWKEAVLDRANSMLQRDKNHPSILIWSCGNESYIGEDILEMSKLLKEKDPSRLVHYEGVFLNREFNDTSDMESRMYVKPQEVVEYLKGNPQKPFILCEYTHAMGNSCGGMKKYTDLEEYPMYQGGFIWDYIDQAIVAIHKNGQELLQYGGDFTDRPTDYQFCGNGIVYADRTPTPKVQEVKFLYQNIKLVPDGTGFMVKNEQLFCSTEQYYFKYKILQDGILIYEEVKEVIIPPSTQSYIAIKHSVTPMTAEYTYEVTAHLKANTLWADKDFELAVGQKVVNLGSSYTTKALNSIEVVYGDVNIGVKTGMLQILFSKQEGMVSLRKNGTELLDGVPMPTYWRAATDNDKGNQFDFESVQWLGADLVKRCVDVSIKEAVDRFAITYTYKLPTVPSTTTTVTYEVNSNETIEVSTCLKGHKELPSLPQFGMKFSLPSDFNEFQWYGLGPDEHYSDRKEGARIGIFEDTPTGNLSKYLCPQECGNRMETRWLKVKTQSGLILHFKAMDLPFEFSVLPYTSMELQSASHQYELPPIYHTNVKIMSYQRGVGGDDSWGAPVHPEYCISSKENLRQRFLITI